MDTLVFDIETKNFFTSAGVGWNNYAAIEISVVGAYSYAQNRYFCLEEREREKIASLFGSHGRLVGFSINRYDVPVLQNYFLRRGRGGVNLWSKERIDLLEEMELATGRRVSLDRLSEANLNARKLRHGWEAIDLYREGRIDELKEYCLKDVRLTKDLYDLYRTRNYLFVPDRATGTTSKILFNESGG